MKRIYAEETHRLATQQPARSRSPLPDWLSETFAALEPHNPLRRLVPPSDLGPPAGRTSPELGSVYEETFAVETASEIVPVSAMPYLQGTPEPEDAHSESDRVFAFSPPPIVKTHFVPNHISRPSMGTDIHSVERHSFPVSMCESDVLHPRASDPRHELVLTQPKDPELTSDLSPSLLEIWPTSRPFGTPGPIFYPRTPISVPAILNTTLNTASVTPAGAYLLSSRSAPSVPEAEGIQRQAIVFSRDAPDPAFSFSLRRTFSDEYIRPDGENHAYDAGEHLQPTGRLFPTADLKTPYFESPAEPLDIDVDFCFARAPGLAAPSAQFGHREERLTNSPNLKRRFSRKENLSHGQGPSPPPDALDTEHVAAEIESRNREEPQYSSQAPYLRADMAEQDSNILRLDLCGQGARSFAIHRDNLRLSPLPLSMESQHPCPSTQFNDVSVCPHVSSQGEVHGQDSRFNEASSQSVKSVSTITDRRRPFRFKCVPGFAAVPVSVPGMVATPNDIRNADQPFDESQVQQNGKLASDVDQDDQEYASDKENEDPGYISGVSCFRASFTTYWWSCAFYL